jgi:anti-sigma B factor antagonist
MLKETSVERLGDIAILKINGPLTAGPDSRKLNEAVDSLFSDGFRKVIVDMSNVEHLDSTGAGNLVLAYTKFYKEDGEVVLLQPGRRLKEFLTMSKLSSIFYIADTREDAIHHLEEPTV